MGNLLRRFATVSFLWLGSLLPAGCDQLNLATAPKGETLPSALEVSFDKEITSDQATLSWPIEEAAESYNVKVCSESSCENGCGDVISTKTSSIVLTMSHEKSVYGCVARVSASGQIGSYKASVKALVVDKTAPEVLVEVKSDGQTATLKAITSESGVSYVWEKYAGEGELIFVSRDEAITTVTASRKGDYLIRLTAKDVAGNATMLSKTVPFTGSETTVSISSPQAVSVIPAALVSAYPVSGSCTEDQLAVALTVSDGVHTVKPLATVLCNPAASPNWATTVNLSTLDTGVLTFKALHIDASGHTASAAVSGVMNYGRDSNAPLVSITKNADPMVRAGDLQSLSFSASDVDSGLARLRWSFSADGLHFGALNELSLNASSLSFTLPVNEPSASAAQIKITATDAAGNTTNILSSPFIIAKRIDDIFFRARYSEGYADGLKDEARFTPSVNGLSSDGTNLYVSMYACIRKIVIATGTTSTLAGNCNEAGDSDGIGASARFRNPTKGAIAGGFLYVADRDSFVIRKINLNAGSSYAEVATVAGGLASSAFVNGTGLAARFEAPSDMTTDGVFLYLADRNRIRKIEIATMVVTTLAGATGGFVDNADPTLVRFNYARSLVYDSTQAKIYVIDVNSAMLRIVVPGTGATSSYNGTFKARGIKDGAAASVNSFVDPLSVTSDGSFLYVVDKSYIKKVDILTGAVTSLAGSTDGNGYADGVGSTAKLGAMSGAVLVAGFLYLADNSNQIIRKVDVSTGQVSRMAGLAMGSAAGLDVQSGFTSNAGLLSGIISATTIDGDTFYIAQAKEYLIRKYVLSTNTVTTIAGSPYERATFANGNGAAATFNDPWSLVQVGTSLYVADSSNHRIRKIDLSDPNYPVTTVAGSGVAGFANADGAAAQFSRPRGITSDGTNLYVADHDNNRIRKIVIGGLWTVSTIAGTGVASMLDDVGASATFKSPWAIKHQSGYLYVADSGNHAIRKINLGAGPNQVTTLAGNGAAGSADGIGAAASFNNPRGIESSATHLYIGDIGSGMIRKLYLADNSVTTIVGGSGSIYTVAPRSSRLLYAYTPYALYYTAGKLHFWEWDGAPGLRILDEATQFVTIATAHPTNMLNPGWSVTGWRDGVITQQFANNFRDALLIGDFIYALDVEGFALVRMNKDGSNPSVVLGSRQAPGFKDGNGSTARLGWINRMATDGSYIYLSDSSAAAIRRFRISTGELDTIAGGMNVSDVVDGTGSGAATTGPDTLTVAGGNLYWTERSKHVIRKLSLQSGSFGVVTTVAGLSGSSGTVNGIGSTARLSSPFAITSIGNMLYWIEGNTIRKMDISTNTVSDFVGLPSITPCAPVDGVVTVVRFCGIDRLVSDEKSNLYAYDWVTATIRKIHASSGDSSTFAGVPYKRSDTNGGPISTTPLSQNTNIRFAPGLGMFMINGASIKLIH